MQKHTSVVFIVMACDLILSTLFSRGVAKDFEITGCYQCSSSTHPECAKLLRPGLHDHLRLTCPETASVGCYALRLGSEVYRGCLATERLKEIYTYIRKAVVCSEKNFCNKKPVPVEENYSSTLLHQ